MHHRWQTVATAIVAVFFTACDAADGEKKHPTFQTTLGVRSPPPGLSATDHIRFVDEAPNGDLFVAGSGGSLHTDTGHRLFPMVARVGPDGTVIWQRIYTDLRNHVILAFAAKDADIYVVLRHIDIGPLAKPGLNYTTTLRRIDAQGKMSAILGQLEGVQADEAIPVFDPELVKFVLAARAQWNATSGQDAPDAGLYEFALDGTVAKRPAGSGVKHIHDLVHTGGDTFVFQRSGRMFSRKVDVVRVDDAGTMTPLVSLKDQKTRLQHIVVAPDRIYLIVSVNPPNAVAQLRAYSQSGEKLWSHTLTGAERVHAAAATRSGNLIVSRSYEDVPEISAFDADGNALWKRRFESVKRVTTVDGIDELGDGRLAFTGSTSPIFGAYASTDSDGVLVVTDSAAAGVSRFATCLENADTIERLRSDLHRRTGIRVLRPTWGQFQDAAGSSNDLPPLGKPLSGEFPCGGEGEKQLVAFLREAIDVATALNLEADPDRAELQIFLKPGRGIPAAGYRERGLSNGGKAPNIDAGYDAAEATVRFIASDVIPYMERSSAVVDRLQSLGKMWVDHDTDSSFFAATLPFKDTVRIAERFLEEYDRQSEDTQRLFYERFRQSPIRISSNKDKLDVRAERIIAFGENRIEDVFAELR